MKINRIKTRDINGKRIPEYITWQSMKNRCSNPLHSAYKYYGAKGIRVCDRWLHSFMDFLIDMGFKPTPQHTINRINNNGNYEPSNCHWATKSEQSQNRTKDDRNGEKNPAVKYCNETVWKIRALSDHYTRYQLSAMFNIPYTTINAIVNRRLWKHI